MGSIWEIATPPSTPSRVRRSARLTCVTLTEQVLVGKLLRPHIDHICGREAFGQRSKILEAWPRTIDRVRLSDHTAPG